MNDSEDTLVGSMLEDLSIEAVVADGGFGTVYRATSGSGVPCAVKVLHGELAGSREALARFEREIQVLERLRHPGIVEIQRVGRCADGRPWFSMELLRGRDLEQHIAECGRLGIQETLEILAVVCRAVTAAHEVGVIHRDIKASNVFITDEGQVVLLDFGIAKISERAPGVSLTRSRQSLGTPAAMAPEQMGSSKSVSALADIYALGAMSYHMLVGRPAFSDSSATLVQYLHCHAARPKPSALVHVPTAVDEAITRAMSIDPADRQDSAKAFVEAMQRAGGSAAAEISQRQSVAIRLDVRISHDDGPGDADLDLALDDADSIWSAARAHFTVRGFLAALEASESMVFVRPGAGGAEQEIRAFETLLNDRIGKHPSVSVALAEKHGAVGFCGDHPVAGSLLSISNW